MARPLNNFKNAIGLMFVGSLAISISNGCSRDIPSEDKNIVGTGKIDLSDPHEVLSAILQRASQGESIQGLSTQEGLNRLANSTSENGSSIDQAFLRKEADHLLSLSPPEVTYYGSSFCVFNFEPDLPDGTTIVLKEESEKWKLYEWSFLVRVIVLADETRE